MAPAGYWLQVEVGIGEQVWVLSPSAGTHPWVGKEVEACRVDLAPERLQGVDMCWEG